jgi:hypothetical protein
VQKAGALYSGIPASQAPLLSGLAQRVLLCEHGGQVFGTDGAKHFVLTDPVRNWGLPVPTVTVPASSPVAGYKRYLVQASYVDAAGNEGGVSDIASVYLPDQGSVNVSVSSAIDAALVRIYISGPEGKFLSLADEFTANRGGYTVTNTLDTAGLPPATEQMRGPISNAAGLTSYRAFLLMWRGNVVFRSEAAEPHLFHPDNIMQFPATVTSVEGLDSGLWVGTEAGLYWVTGEGPEAWIPVKKSLVEVLTGSLAVEGHKLAVAKTRERVALFVTRDGVVMGLPSGDLLPLTDGKYNFPTGTRASLAYVQRDPIRQVFVTVE